MNRSHCPAQIKGNRQRYPPLMAPTALPATCAHQNNPLRHAGRHTPQRVDAVPSRTFLVVGSAACVWDDLDAWGKRQARIVAVNRMVADLPRPITAGATLHPELAWGWRSSRRQGVPWLMWGRKLRPGIDAAVALPDGWHGTSGLYGVRVAMWLGASRIVLAGCPMDDTPHHYDDGALGSWLEHYRHGWRNAFPEIHGRVTSLSGWTRDLLGAPAKE